MSRTLDSKHVPHPCDQRSGPRMARVGKSRVVDTIRFPEAVLEWVPLCLQSRNDVPTG